MQHNKKRFYYLVALSLILVIIVVSLVSCGKKKEEEIKDEAIPVKAIKVERGTIDDMVKYTGKIAAGNEVNVVSKIPGRVSAVNVEVGDYVEKGEPLVFLETDELQAQLMQAEAAAAAARANLKANESGVLPQQVEQVRASLEQAEANYLNAKADYDRYKALYEADAIAKQSFDAMELKYNVAKTQYETAKTQLNLTQGRVPSNVEALKAQVAQAEAAIQLIKTNIANSVINAPVSGVVSAKMIEPGEMASAGYPLATIVNIDQVETVVSVSEEAVSHLEIGEEMDVFVSAIGEDSECKGTISTISPAADQTRLFQVKILLDNDEHRLRPGMFAEVNLKLGQKENVIMIPKDSVLIKKHGNTVFVVKDGKAEEKLVQLGVSQEDKVEITEGLSEGEILVIEGQNLLSDGARVEIQK